MEIIETPIKDLVIIKPRVFEDARGFFCETYNEERYQAAGIKQHFVQDNQSKSSYGVIRGLHFQLAPYSQAKLVSVSIGSVWDVAVDLRKDSPTYGQHFTIRLSSENKKQLLVPQGFAHGFSVLSETAVVLYKCDQFYNKASEGGIRFDDPTLAIDWGMDLKEAIVSDKDGVLPSFEACNSQF